MTRRLHNPLRRKKRVEDTARFAEELAPLEEQKAARHASTHDGVTEEHGAIVVDNQNMNLPKGVKSESDSQTGIEPVVLLILIILIGFIVFITWQISQMPTPK